MATTVSIYKTISVSDMIRNSREIQIAHKKTLGFKNGEVLFYINKANGFFQLQNNTIRNLQGNMKVTIKNKEDAEQTVIKFFSEVNQTFKERANNFLLYPSGLKLRSIMSIASTKNPALIDTWICEYYLELKPNNDEAPAIVLHTNIVLKVSSIGVVYEVDYNMRPSRADEIINEPKIIADTDMNIIYAFLSKTDLIVPYFISDNNSTINTIA
jgi:hypothetical protein